LKDNDGIWALPGMIIGLILVAYLFPRIKRIAAFLLGIKPTEKSTQPILEEDKYKARDEWKVGCGAFIFVILAILIIKALIGK